MSLKRLSQNERVLLALQVNPAGVSAWYLLKLGVYRASARIWDLRKQGHSIDTVNPKRGTAIYVLKGS